MREFPEVRAPEFPEKSASEFPEPAWTCREVSINHLAKAQVRAAEEWWRLNRPRAPTAIREELERASVLISIQPESGARARNIPLPGVRRVHLARVRYHVYYRVLAEPERIETLAFWHASRGGNPPL